MADDQSESLCAKCREINLDELFREMTVQQVLIEPDPVLILNRIPEWTNTPCALCNFWLAMVPKKERDTCDSIYIFRARQTTKNGTTNNTPIMNPSMTPRTTLLVETCNGKPEFNDLPFVNYSKSPETPVLIDHEKVDYAPLREWCGMVQKIQRQMDVLPANVIDCDKREIVPVHGPCDYIALSYVWGPAAAQETPREKNALPTQLPRTVEDAMTVVKELGLRYLWVDRYCLDQSNKEEFKSQLDQMADIYRLAVLTIIGAAGSAADYGLPGVSSQPRIKQPRVKIGDYTLWSSMTDPRKLVRESTWMTRAWTYQEGVFSWNWFAFTDEQVFFQRSNTEWANMERWWKLSSEMFPHGGLGAQVNCPLLKMFDNVTYNEGALHQLLIEYTSRKLSYQSDALNGALGLLKRCGNGPYCMNHYFGIPILGPLINHRKSTSRDPSRSWTLTEAFLVNICWKAQGSGTRRSEFPSWSWTGWQVVYETPGQSLIHLGLSARNLINPKVSVQTKNGLVDWETMCKERNWDVYEDFSSLPHELYIQAPVVDLTLCQDPRASGNSMSGHAAETAAMKWCAWFSDEECDVLVEVNLVDPTVESMILDSGQVSLKGLLLRQIDPEKSKTEVYSYHENYYWALALILLEGDQGTTRVGSIELRLDNYFVSWKHESPHPEAKKDTMWIRNELKEYVECIKCREAALKRLVGMQKEEVVKIL